MSQPAHTPAAQTCIRSGSRTAGNQDDRSAARTATGSGTATVPALVSSDELLRGQPCLSIAHNGAVYRLQTTRQGKLILTK